MTNAGKKGQWSFIKIACLLASQPLLVLLLFRFKYMVQDLPFSLQLSEGVPQSFMDEGVSQNSVFALFCLIPIKKQNSYICILDRLSCPLGLMTPSVFLVYPTPYKVYKMSIQFCGILQSKALSVTHELNFKKISAS